jgi:hypothetical protein
MGSEVFGDGGTFEEGKGGACVEFDEGEHGFIIGEDKANMVGFERRKGVFCRAKKIVGLSEFRNEANFVRRSRRFAKLV